MSKDFLTYVPRPANLLRALRKVTLGVAVSATGVAMPPAADGAQPDAPGLAPIDQAPLIVDQRNKSRKLILQLPNQASYRISDHRSHRSHSSHRSHYSGGGGGGGTTTPAPVRTTPPPAPLLEKPEAATAATAVTGIIETLDREKRTFVIRYTISGETQTTRQTFAYRDDTKFQTAIGLSYRFDEFAETNNGRLPIGLTDRVEVQWRTSADGKTSIATTIQRKP